MPIFRPSELRSFLAEIGKHPQKSLSQNFLIDGNVLNNIITCSACAPGDLVVEIGPGPGALTEKLLEAGTKVLAIEKDAVFAELLPRLDPENKMLEVHSNDFLKFPLKERLQELLETGKKAKVVANIPYHLTSPIIEKVIEARNFIESVTLMVQDEVALRMCTSSGKDIGSFSIFVQFYGEPHYAFIVPKKCFYPAPHVDSAVVHIVMNKRFNIAEKPFFEVVHNSFQHRRKMLRSSLKELYSLEKITEALKLLKKNETARPEELSFEEWIQFFKFLEL